MAAAQRTKGPLYCRKLQAHQFVIYPLQVGKLRYNPAYKASCQQSSGQATKDLCRRECHRILHNKPTEHDEKCEWKKASLILLIDFRKAFDSIDHNFISTVLKELGFGNDIIKWISIFFDSHEAYILLGGNLSKKYFWNRECHKGMLSHPISLLSQ